MARLPLISKTILIVLLVLALPSENGYPDSPHPHRVSPLSSRFPTNESTRGYIVQKGESLPEIARRFGLGYQQMVQANRGIDPFVPGAGTEVTIPRWFIVPQTGKREGIVINLSEMRLYLFAPPRDRGRMRSYPVGIGIEGNETPVGRFRIQEKIVNPSWHVPRSIRSQRPYLPRELPPGPENPLGTHALRLSDPTILIHGTNKPWGVGMRASHGCIRLYPEQIPDLFSRVRVGTPVEIVRQPVKMLLTGGRVYMEVHEDAGSGKDYFMESFRLIVQHGVSHLINIRKVVQAIFDKKGYPVEVGR